MVTIERYRHTRYWSVSEGGELLCVTLYKKGAVAVKARLERGAPLPRVSPAPRVPLAPSVRARLPAPRSRRRP
jgi:6-phosphogluconolactonase (cycloisomerase 2 family)